MTVFIFGDSYGDEKSKYRNTYRTWFDMIDEKVVNTCRGSGSIYYSVRELNKLVDDIQENDKIVFILTNKCRLDFPFIEDTDHIGAAIEVKDDAIGHVLEQQKYLLDYSDEIKLVFSMFDQEIDMHSFLIISYLKYISQKKKCKVIVLPAFDSIKYNLKVLDPFYFNSNNFKVLDMDLFTVSQEEFVDELYDQEIENKRKCHLSFENHVVLFNIISNFFYGTNRMEDFYKDLYKTKGEKIERFIYD